MKILLRKPVGSIQTWMTFRNSVYTFKCKFFKGNLFKLLKDVRNCGAVYVRRIIPQYKQLN